MSHARPILSNARRALAEGDAATAEALYRLCTVVAPADAEAHRGLGRVALARADQAGALRCLEEARRLAPDDAEVEIEIGGLLAGLRRVSEAVAAARRAVVLAPRLARAHSVLAEVLEAAGDGDGALAACERAGALDPGSFPVRLKLATVLRGAGRLPDALDHVDAAVGLDPDHYGARIVRALILDALGRTEPAGHDLAAAARLCPAGVEPCLATAVVAIGLRQEALAEEILQRAQRLAPRHADVYVVLGSLRLSQGRAADAHAAFVAALALDPGCVRAHYHLGGLLLRAGRLEEAVAACRQAIALAPDRDEAWLNLGAALRLLGRLPEAVASYSELLRRGPGNTEALVELGALRRQLCDWDGLAALEATSLARSVGIGRRVSPFTLFAATGDPAVHRSAARLWADGLRRDRPPEEPRNAAERQRPLRVGYLSGDFHDHATAMLVVELFERHDRARLESFGYSYGPDDGSAMRRRLAAALDHFTDIRNMAHPEAADRIRHDGIDILVDLKGYLHDARTEILAFRPAPIQVNFLGYPGTMGAEFIDYIIADAIVAPPGREANFDEAIVRLPHCYQPNDRCRPLPDPGLARAACGLPETGVVLACLNNSYKIRPEVFDVWMRLLRGAPGAALWLLEDNPWVAPNLRREAAARGVDPGRLVFAPRVAPARHLARLGLADLFLDTLPVNAHTTASEALWAGVPVVTVLGDAFVSRVAASLLHAVGLPELVTTSLEAYEALALALLRDPPRLAALRGHLEASRATAPLFDTPRYARHFEDALARMAALRDAGLRPRSFTIEG